jgi:hypothetical protein
MKKRTKISVLSLAKFQGVLMALIGLICGILYSFGGLIIDALVSAGVVSSVAMSTPGLSYGTVLAFGALIGMPIIFATSGFLMGILEALLYNLFSNSLSGMKIDFNQKE